MRNRNGDNMVLSVRPTILVRRSSVLTNLSLKDPTGTQGFPPLTVINVKEQEHDQDLLI